MKTVDGIVVEQDETDYRHFRCKINGPPDTPYAGGVFPVEVFCPNDYPMKAPMCLFRCKIYHPNINARGQICLSILKPKTEENKEGWSPALKIQTVSLLNNLHIFSC